MSEELQTWPARIWLQTENEAQDGIDAYPRPFDTTWCQDQISKHDVEYVRADTVAATKGYVQIPTSTDMARLMLGLGYRYLKDNAPEHLIDSTSPASDAELPPLPTLSQRLLDRISDYGLARTEGLSDPDRVHCWEMLIAGIKDYAIDYARAASTRTASDTRTAAGEAACDAALRAAPAGQHSDPEFIIDTVINLVGTSNLDEVCSSELVEAFRKVLADGEPKAVDRRRCPDCNATRGGDKCWKCGTATFEPDPRCGDDPRLPPLDRIRELAREVGYAIGVHGSQQRDLDVIAAPWADCAIGAHALLSYIAAGLVTDNGPAHIISTESKPLGRFAATIQMDGWYKQLDISVCPSSQYATASTDAATRSRVEGGNTQIEKDGCSRVHGNAAEVDVEVERQLYLRNFPAYLPGCWSSRQEEEFNVWLAARTQADAGKGSARLNALIDWYLRGGKRSEIHEFGHIEFTTREHIIAWCDAQSTTTKPENK